MEKLKAAGWEHNPPSVCLELRVPEYDEPILCDPTCDDIDFDAACVTAQTELARRAAAHEEAIRQEAIEQEREKAEEEKLVDEIRGGNIIIVPRPALADWIPVENFWLEDLENYLVAYDREEVTVAKYCPGDPYGEWQDLLHRSPSGETYSVDGAVTHIIPFPKHPNHGN